MGLAAKHKRMKKVKSAAKVTVPLAETALKRHFGRRPLQVNYLLPNVPNYGKGGRSACAGKNSSWFSVSVHNETSAHPAVEWSCKFSPTIGRVHCATKYESASVNRPCLEIRARYPGIFLTRIGEPPWDRRSSPCVLESFLPRG